MSVQMPGKEWSIAEPAKEGGMDGFEGEPYRRSVRDAGVMSNHASSAVSEPLFVVVFVITQELITRLPKLHTSDISDRGETSWRVSIIK